MRRRGWLSRFGSQPHTRGKGDVAESAALVWLRRRGYRVVATNARTPAGEIDVVAWDGEILCFVEIKARSGSRYGSAAAAVTPQKQHRIARAAALYLTRLPESPACRFDVLAMDRDDDGDEWRFSLLRDAFIAPS